MKRCKGTRVLYVWLEVNENARVHPGNILMLYLYLMLWDGHSQFSVTRGLCVRSSDATHTWIHCLLRMMLTDSEHSQLTSIWIHHHHPNLHWIYYILDGKVTHTVSKKVSTSVTGDDVDLNDGSAGDYLTQGLLQSCWTVETSVFWTVSIWKSYHHIYDRCMTIKERLTMLSQDVPGSDLFSNGGIWDATQSFSEEKQPAALSIRCEKVLVLVCNCTQSKSTSGNLIPSRSSHSSFFQRGQVGFGLRGGTCPGEFMLVSRPAATSALRRFFSASHPSFLLHVQEERISLPPRECDVSE